MTNDNVQNFFIIPLLCVLGLSLCWAVVPPRSNKLSELNREFSMVQAPSGATREGDVRRIEAFALQIVLANYVTDMRAKDLERYYDGVLKKNGWINRTTAYTDNRHLKVYCKGELDAVLDKDSTPGHYFFSMRRRQEPSLSDGCA